MAKAIVYNNHIVAGVLEKKAADDYRFMYEDSYLADTAMPSISISLPKTKKEHQSKLLFSFFFGLLAEGINKDIQCRLLRIDEEDDFARLLKTTGEDTIGAITIKEINE
jgi:HipA-like protein